MPVIYFSTRKVASFAACRHVGCGTLHGHLGQCLGCYGPGTQMEITDSDDSDSHGKL